MLSKRSESSEKKMDIREDKAEKIEKRGEHIRQEKVEDMVDLKCV
jgi:hypothetical protein